MQVQNVEHAGFVAAVIHNVDSNSLLRMHAATRKSKQQIIIAFVKLEFWIFCRFFDTRKLSKVSYSLKADCH